MSNVGRTVRVATWVQAEDVVRDIAQGLPVLYGTGNPVHKAHVVAVSMDAWSSGDMGYHVTVYPHGSDGREGVVYHTIYVG